jgi:hypothetical protein
VTASVAGAIGVVLVRHLTNDSSASPDDDADHRRLPNSGALLLPDHPVAKSRHFLVIIVPSVSNASLL